MKKTFAFIVLALATAAFAAAQEPTAQDALAEAAQEISEAPQQDAPAPKPNYWTNSVELNVGLNQTQLSNWAAGGYNTVTLNSGLDAKADYAKDLASWTNRLQMQYGFLYSDEKIGLIQKNTDRLYLESKFAYKTGPDSKWRYSATFDARTQFSDNYDSYVKDAVTDVWSGTLKSGFLAPAYINLGLGMDWAPAPWFSLNVAPLTGAVVIVQIDTLRKNYGMELINDTVDPALSASYKSVKFQLGAQVKMGAKAKVNDNLSLETQLVLFSNYLKDPQNLRVNWDNKVFWKLAKYFALTLSTNLIYDENVKVKALPDGNVVPAVQFKEFFEFGFTYTIAKK